MEQGWLAPAKINLFLHVIGRRQDGYHNLQTVFQLLNYCDELSFSITDQPEIKHTRLSAGVDVDNELCLRAARLLQQSGAVNRGVEITLNKRIPLGGGFGGGSSDAATTLQALNKLWQVNLGEDELALLALQLGADVPVFLRGFSAWAEGVGEELTPIKLNSSWYVLIMPNVRVATGEIFSHPELTRDSPPITIRAFREGRTRNDLEAVVCMLYPQVNQALQWLRSFGNASMTGSGAGVFLPVTSHGEAEEILAQCPSPWSGFVAAGLDQSPLPDRLAQEN